MTLQLMQYREFTPWNWSTYLFILCAVLLSCYPLLADSGRDASTIIGAIILGLVLNLIEGAELIVGSNNPNKLKERICDLSGISFHE